MTMRCEDVRDALNAYLDARLEDAEADLLGGHLKTCPACRREMDALRRTRSLVSSAGRLAAPEAWVREAVHSAAGRQEPARLPRSRRFGPPWALSSLAAAAALAVIFVSLRLSERTAPVDLQSREMAEALQAPPPPSRSVGESADVVKDKMEDRRDAPARKLSGAPEGGAGTGTGASGSTEIAGGRDARMRAVPDEAGAPVERADPAEDEEAVPEAPAAVARDAQKSAPGGFALMEKTAPAPAPAAAPGEKQVAQGEEQTAPATAAPPPAPAEEQGIADAGEALMRQAASKADEKAGVARPYRRVTLDRIRFTEEAARALPAALDALHRAPEPEPAGAERAKLSLASPGALTVTIKVVALLDASSRILAARPLDPHPTAEEAALIARLEGATVDPALLAAPAANVPGGAGQPLPWEAVLEIVIPRPAPSSPAP